MSLAETLELTPLAGDLVRVEDELRESVRHNDRFLGDVAAHLVEAGGKRVRPIGPLFYSVQLHDR